MKKHFALTALAVLVATPAAHADETGLASIHDWRQEKGRRVCMSDHFHDGAGSAKTRKAAEAAAQRSWIDFTAFEYGSAWGSYKIAASKSLDCTEAGSRWSCVINARPCKVYQKGSKNYSKSASR